ncbi:MAG: VWA domain-containing protein [Acidobacteriota bacterium]|nr:VWA domain-containing protein [Acidobacteriota bacterium]
MTFERAWVLIFCVLPLAWAAWEWRSSSRRLALALKTATLLAIVFALSEPRLIYNDTKVALALLVDTSASVSPRDLAAASSLATRLENVRGRNVMRVIPFARGPRNPSPLEYAKFWNLRYTAGNAGHGTNLESAIRDGVASLPSGMVPRLAIISDGNENAGTVTRATWQARQLGIPIDTFPMAGRPKPNLRTDSVSLPAQVFSGERFPIDLTVTAPRATPASVEINAEGKKIGASAVELHDGENRFRVRASLTAVGALDLAGKISAPGLGEARFEQAVTVRRPRVLVLSQDPAGTDVHLMQTFQANQFDVQSESKELPPKLDDYQLIVFNNWDLEAIPTADKMRIEDFERQGGGLLVIAGEKNVYVEKKPGTPEDALERALPAKLAPPRSPEGTCVILIIDKSSSMEGKKMELARMASIGVIENLRPIDTVGVLIFDNSFQWAVPLRKAEDRSLIKRLIAGITPDGGTQIAPALAEAYRKVLPVNAVFKHIVLLTDGISEEGDSMSLAREAANNKVTISTVGLGQDVNRAYLEKIASFSKGKAYFLNDPSGLEQILLKDVQEHTGTTAIEKPTRAGVVKKTELLEGTGIESAPPLQGYVRFISKPGADDLLNVDQSLTKKDPLLVRWQYGLGRSAVFTSDAKSRWASAWVTWPGFDRFWTNVFRDLLPHAPASEATAAYDSASDDLVVDYRLGRHVEDPETVPDIFVFGPNGFHRPMKVSKVAAGTYKAKIFVGNTQGLFRVRPLKDSRAFPEIGFYRQESEMSDYGSNEFLLRQIAESTGGRFQPSVGNVFDSGGRAISSSMQLWPGLLALAIVLNLAELLLRKWRGMAEALGFRPAEAAVV